MLPPGGEISEDLLAELRDLRTQMTVGRKSLSSRSLDPEVRKRQEKIFSESKQFLDAVLTKRKVEANDLNAFAGKMRPLLQASMAEAAQAELDALDRRDAPARALISAQKSGNNSAC